MKERKVYLIHVFRKRLDYPSLKREVRNQASLYRPQVILIEDKASGTPLIQELRREGCGNTKACKPEGDKVMRMNTQSAFIERGQVLLPRQAPWLADYRLELGSFPRGRHDDQVDSTSQALAWIQNCWQTFDWRYIPVETRRFAHSVDDEDEDAPRGRWSRGAF